LHHPRTSGKLRFISLFGGYRMTAASGVKAALVGLATVAFTACTQQTGDSAATIAGAGEAQTPGGYVVPRTPWGDPDLQGKWPGTALVGVPMQRDEKLGTRNVLTDEEFTAREAQFARQTEQDHADFDLESAADTPGGDVGGPVSPPRIGSNAVNRSGKPR
jgi:hypothetical protein